MTPKAAHAGACVVALLSAIAVDAGCRRRGDERPVASLASSPESEARFDQVRARWAEATSAERAAMRPLLASLVDDLGREGDGLEPIARAYLAIAWLDAGVPAAAEAIAGPLIEGPPGVVADLATTVKGAAARRRGRPLEAIELLRPLVGKLLDPFARPLLFEEITAANLDAERWDDAIVFAEGWLRSVPPAERKELRAVVTRALRRLPQSVAMQILEAQASIPPEARASPDLLLVLQARIETGAEPTIVEAPPLEGDDAGAVEGGLANGTPPPATPVGPPRFDPRTIVVLAPTSASGHAASAAAVVRAIASVVAPALASAGHDAGVDAPAQSAHRLAVFDTGGTALGVSRALDAAERAGAGVVVGGLLDAEANALAALSQGRRIPTVLLRRPSVTPTVPAGDRRTWIAVGPSAAEEAHATLAIAQAATGEGVVVEPWPAPGVASDQDPSAPATARCDATTKVAGGRAFPVVAWQARKVATITVLGDARCARRVIDDVAAVPGFRPAIVVGPAALEIAHAPTPLPRTFVTAGILPATESAPASLRLLWVDQSAPVGWFGALGHDAAILAADALPGDLLPTAEPAGIQRARTATLARLAASKGDLWSTDARGPAASGIVPRTTSLRTLAAGTAIQPTWAR
jgi:hypothetical protein